MQPCKRRVSLDECRMDLLEGPCWLNQPANLETVRGPADPLPCSCTPRFDREPHCLWAGVRGALTVRGTEVNNLSVPQGFETRKDNTRHTDRTQNEVGASTTITTTAQSKTRDAFWRFPHGPRQTAAPLLPILPRGPTFASTAPTQQPSSRLPYGTVHSIRRSLFRSPSQWEHLRRRTEAQKAPCAGLA